MRQCHTAAVSPAGGSQVVHRGQCAPLLWEASAEGVAVHNPAHNDSKSMLMCVVSPAWVIDATWFGGPGWRQTAADHGHHECDIHQHLWKSQLVLWHVTPPRHIHDRSPADTHSTCQQAAASMHAETSSRLACRQGALLATHSSSSSAMLDQEAGRLPVKLLRCRCLHRMT